MIKDKYEEYQAELAINAMIIQSNKAMKEANEQMKQTNDKYNQQINDLRQSEVKMIQNAQNTFPMPEKIKLPN